MVNNTPCPDDETLACYVDDLLPIGERQEVDKHLTTCDRCKEAVEISKRIKQDERQEM